MDTETNVTFCLKEWRAFLLLAESLNANISIQFETTGLPIEFTVQDLDVFEVTLFMSTLSSELDNTMSDSVIVLSDSRATPATHNGKTTNKRGHDAGQVDEELAVLLKKPKGRMNKQPPPPPLANRLTSSSSSTDQFSNPSIEDYSNKMDTSKPVDSNDRLTVARSADENNQLNVPTMESNRISTVSPRNHDKSHEMEIIFLRDTEDDSDRTLSQIPMPDAAGGHRTTMATIRERVAGGGGDDDDNEEEDEEPQVVVDAEIPLSPVHNSTREKRRAALTIFRRCYEPSFKPNEVTGLNRILAESSGEEDN